MAWEELLSIYKEAADQRRAEKSQPPVACPRDGEPLTAGPDGTLHCRFDGYVYPRDGR